ncbi:hypothetical protein LEP1GSC188_4218 [Leptospira weilii serovar Topaz str. LT2116]|uniref:DUF192 domain-containing protein n=1 Tax=Leptospira weilii serovar Topaz str. LT2116 TaxID=1088540 RepID=M3FUA4_9LEPT|nr:DUF192 domain-containing protein [Leptospira weilii]EMF83857.1 hypothetical protein LEP1GSC188_4218 [Leptospira weilii serovar Topaz str. LT2116]
MLAPKFKILFTACPKTPVYFVRKIKLVTQRLASIGARRVLILSFIFGVSYNVFPRELERITIYVDEHPLLVEIANTPADRARGLMYRKSIGENEGMLFVFAKPEYLSFWMKNTRIPLSIAYFNQDRRITDVHDMKPNQTTELYHSSEKALYALEVNQGWFSKRKIGKYGVLKIPDRVRAVQ